MPSRFERHFLSFDRHGHHAARFCRTRPFFEILTYPNTRNILHRVEKNAKPEQNSNAVEHFASRLDVRSTAAMLLTTVVRSSVSPESEKQPL